MSRLRGKRVVVFGLAKSGLSALKLLEREGARLTAVDQRNAMQLGSVATQLESRGVTLLLGEDPGGAPSSAPPGSSPSRRVTPRDSSCVATGPSCIALR